MTATIDFDDDLFDAIIIAERSGPVRWAKPDVARILGISEKSLWHFIRRGIIDAPSFEAVPPDDERAVWTTEQVARALIRRGKVAA